MAKKIICKPAPEIELSYQSGDEVKNLLLRFDVQAAQVLQEEENGIENVFNKSYSEMCAALIYAAAANNNNDFTKEDAKVLVACMSLDNLAEIVNAFTEGFSSEVKGLQNEYSKNLMAQFLNSRK